MAKLRYVKTLEQVKKAREANPEFLKSSVRSIRAEYETDPEIYRALVPKPLEPGARPLVCATFTDISMHLPGQTLRIGATIFGPLCRYDGREGVYLVTMPMTTEQSVVGGRETYGEAKKIAQIDFSKEGGSVSSRVSRMGFSYLSASGRIGKALGPREFTQLGYCFKMFPSCEPERAFDYDPLLVQLNWIQKHENAWQLEDAKLELGASPLDPVADVPVRRITRFEYEEGTTQSNGKVLRSVPEEWVLPILHQRYDDASGDGIEIEVGARS
jgi:acetoacetate decarboxylase